jgi:apolipoprotein N-acyltransferase
MKKTTLFLVVLVVFSTLLVAGCTQQQPGATPERTPVVTLPTVPGQINQTVANLSERAEQKVANLTNRTEQKVANLSERAEQKVANLTDQAEQKVANLSERAEQKVANLTIPKP